MAVVINPFMSEKARGSVGGMTASIGPSGPIMKRKSTPVRRVRTTQPQNRSILGFLSREWGTLTNDQRTGWKQYANDNPGTDKFGTPFIMSGINAYTKLNSGALRLYGIGNLQTLPPSSQPVSNLSGLTATTGAGNPGDVDLTWALYGTGIAADLCEIWLTQAFQSAGRVEVIEKFKYETSVAGNIALVTVANLQEGFWYWFRARYTDQYGQVTAWLYDQATPKVTV